MAKAIPKRNSYMESPDYMPDPATELQVEHTKLIAAFHTLDGLAERISTKTDELDKRDLEALYGSLRILDGIIPRIEQIQEALDTPDQQRHQDETPPAHPPQELPFDLTMPGGATVTMENLVSQLALLKATLEHHADLAASHAIYKPLSYLEAQGLYEIASTAYYALAGTLYKAELVRNENYV